MDNVNIKRIVGGVLFGTLLSGCNSAETTLTEYAQLRWEAMIRGNLDEAYTYYSDTFKETTPLDVFRNQVRGTGLWSEARVTQVNCEDSGARCEVDVEVTVSMRMRGLSKPIETSDTVKETWIKEGWFSDWRYVKQ